MHEDVPVFMIYNAIMQRNINSDTFTHPSFFYVDRRILINPFYLNIKITGPSYQFCHAQFSSSWKERSLTIRTICIYIFSFDK